MRHRGGGTKRRIRSIDFTRALWNIIGKVCRFEYDPNRNTLICLIAYSIGVLSYIIAVESLKIRSVIVNFSKKKKHRKVGCANFLKIFYKKQKLNNLELYKNTYSKFFRASGSFGLLLKKDTNFCWVKLKSGIVRKFSSHNLAVIGSILNFNYYLYRYKTAGLGRLRGNRPAVRGVAMNPIDHPHGGGEGKKSKKKVCMSPWGKLIKGKKTRYF